MPSPSVDIMWQEIRMLKTRICAIEDCCVAGTMGKEGSTGMLEFVVGEPATSAYYTKDIVNVTLPVTGTYTLTIKDTNIKPESVDVYWDGGIMAKDRADRESYSIAYYTDKVEITRLTGYPFVTGQFYIIKYAYSV